MSQPLHPAPRPRKSVARLLWLLLTAFVVYGTTIPFRFDIHRWSLEQMLHRVNWTPVGDNRGGMSLPDIVQNILLFIPWGFLGYISLIEKRSLWKQAVIVLMGTALSATVEFLQIFSETRYPALSDVIFNTMGAAVGLVIGTLLKKSVLEFKTHPGTRRLVEAESAFPALVFMILAIAGCWEPFDFSLDVSSAWEKVKPLLHHPFQLTLPNDEMISFIRFLLASLFLCRLLREWGLPRAGLAGAALTAALGVALEGSQLIIQSRAPEFQDAVVAVLGALAGGVAFLFPGFHERPWTWGLVGGIGIFLSVAMRELYPFHFSAAHSGFNWIPFLPHYENTSFTSLGNFVESCMAYFPLGFLVAYFFRGSRRALWLSALAAFASALALEWAQGYLPGRYADVTDGVGAVLGNLAGTLAMTRGWKAFRGYMDWDERV
jgi:glycopeptide antibiotics resistance protein